MPQRMLATLLGACAAIAIWPVVPWLLAFGIDSMDDGWLGAMAVTMPLGLGLGAIVLALHGLVLQRELVDGLQDDFDESLQQFVAAGLGQAVPASVSVAPVRSNTTAGAEVATERPSTAAATGTAVATPTEATPAADTDEANGKADGKAAEVGGKAKDAARKAGKQAGMRVARRTKSKAKNAARRGFRDLFRGVGPRL